MKWLRLYTEIIDDIKVLKMHPKLFKFFIFLLLLASECDQDGTISLSKKDISWRLRTSLKNTNLYLNELKNLNIITENPMISFINWNKRQYKSDNASERSRQWRANK